MATVSCVLEVLYWQSVEQAPLRWFRKSPHSVACGRGEESIARKELKCCIFEGLVANALANISALRARRRELETEQQRLTSRMRSKSSVVTGMGASDAGFTEGIGTGNNASKLERIELELNQIGYITPEVSLNQVNTTFEHPEDFISMQKLSINLDKSGILRPSNGKSHSAHNLKLFEVTIKGQPSRVVTLVKISGDELGSRELRFPPAI